MSKLPRGGANRDNCQGGGENRANWQRAQKFERGGGELLNSNQRIEKYIAHYY